MLAAAATLVLGACSTEDLAEKAAEEAIEQQLEANGENGENVDIDLDDGEINIETPDGSTVIDVNDDGEGNISIQGEGSDGDVDIDIGGDDGETVISTPDGQAVIGSGELPDDFPGNVPVPEGATIDAGSSMTSGDGLLFSVTGSLDGEFGDATDAYKAALESAGFEQQSMTESPDGTFFAFISAEWNVTGGIFPDSTDGEGSQFGINVIAATT